MFGRQREYRWPVSEPSARVTSLCREMASLATSVNRLAERNSCTHCPSWHDELRTVRLDGDTGVLRRISIKTCRVCGKQLGVEWLGPVTEEA